MNKNTTTFERLGATCAFPALGSLLLSALLCAALVISAHRVDTPLGAPAVWAWALTAVQIAGLWGAGRGDWWGWLVGAGVQAPWIAYALLTGQFGFIPGCLVSGVVQCVSYLRGCRRGEWGRS